MNNDLITEGRKLLDSATPGPWEAFGTSAANILDHCNCTPEEPYGHQQYCGAEGPVAHADEPDIAWIVWARNNLPALLDRFEVALTKLTRVEVALDDAHGDMVHVEDIQAAMDGGAL